MSATLKRATGKLQYIFGSSHRLAPLMRFKDYAEQRDKSCYHLIESGRETVVRSTYFFGDEAMEKERFSLPDAYWVDLHDGTVIGGSSVVVTSDHKMLYDLLTDCDRYNANITDNGLFMLFGKPHNIGNRYFYSYRRRAGKHIDKGISLASNMSSNYYHFMFQVAAKFYYIDLVGFDKSIPLLIDEQALCVPQMRAIVDILNKSEREIIPLHTGALYEVGDLYCISDPNLVIPNRKAISFDNSHVFAFDKKALVYLRERFLSVQDTPPFVPPQGWMGGDDFVPLQGGMGGETERRKTPKRIFLSRKDCSRRTVNESELKPILERYGFEFVYPGEMDILSQVRLFSQAEYIVGSSGAAFTNLLFCSEGCRVLLFIAHRHNTTCYSSLAAPLGVETMFIAGDGDPSTLHVLQYNIDCNTLEAYLKQTFNPD